MALDRMREQRAMKLLDALQDDLRAQMRLEKDELGRNGENKRASVRRKARIARLSDPNERERIWSREQLPSYEVEHAIPTSIPTSGICFLSKLTVSLCL